MVLPYPFQQFGPFRLGVGFTAQALHDVFGADLGERYYKDIEYRVQTAMEIDRQVYERYRALDLGFDNPFPRVSIEPFGHRFMPAMYGCECHFSADSEPWGRPRVLPPEEIDALAPWTVERFEQSDPVRQVLDQARQMRKIVERHPRMPEEMDFNPHHRALSTLQNLGSVVNTAFTTQGDQFMMDYLMRPDTVHKFYANIRDLTLLCLKYFPEFDGVKLKDVFIGNCTVAMLSPQQYLDFNHQYDLPVMEYARQIGASFTMHQDSNVNPHLENYGKFSYLHAVDFGQDTDFEKCAQAMGRDIHANCMFFPSWIQSSTPDQIREELTRLMRIGLQFREFTFTLYEIDTKLAQGPIFEFVELFKECASRCAGPAGVAR